MLALTVAAGAFAQGSQTGTITGTAVDAQGLSLPGVTIAVSSPSMQGMRTAVTDINGNYSLPQLPPGGYLVVFTLSGFGGVEEMATVPLGGAVGVNAVMAPAGVTETVQVVGVVPAEIQTTETASNLAVDEVNALPIGRSPFAIAAIQPGLNTNTPNAGQLAINGAFAYDNVYLIDGVDTNDNLFGTSNNLFVEDAIEETQVLTSGISAEYGRFSGGVVNVITKSGGNTFSGSWRTNLDNPTWEGLNPYEVENEVEREDILNQTHEATFGGPIVRDRLWFFSSYRRARTTNSDSFAQTGLSYNDRENNDRNQLKLTATLVPGHTLSGQYMRNQTSRFDDPTFSFSITPDTQVNALRPNDLYVTTYRGSLSQNVFAEAQVSAKRFGFRGGGGEQTAIGYSPFITLTQQLGHFNGPYFDATDPEDRNNLQTTGSVTWYKGTESLGSHSIKVGFERYRSTRTGGNSQSSTGYVFDVDYKVDANGDPVFDGDRLIPVFSQFDSLIENWLPTRGARIDLSTTSFFINDNWAFNDHLSFNLGVRGETVTGEASGDITTVDTRSIVPRVAVSLDPLGDGRYSIQATYSHYSGKYSEAQFAENTNVGNPSLLFGYYTGPTHECPGLPDATAFDCPGLDPNNYQTFFGSFPTQNVFSDDRLNSPITQEFTLSSGTTLGTRGYFQATYVRRRSGSFVEDYQDLSTGVTTLMDPDTGDEYGTFTNQVFANPGDLGDDPDVLQRNYDGLQFETRYQFFDNLLVNASATIQLKNEGNFDGEGTNQPGVSSVYGDWPEVTPAERFYPWGRLDDYQKHRLRVWAIYTLGMGFLGDLDVGGFWRYDSADNFSLASSSFRVSDEQQLILDQLGYIDGPTSRTLYYASGRGSELYNGVGRVDLSLHWDVPVWREFRPWVKFEVFNLTNNDKLVSFNTTIRHDASGPTDALGIPTTYTEGSNYGEATSAGNHPGARVFQVAAGFPRSPGAPCGWPPGVSSVRPPVHGTGGRATDLQPAVFTSSYSRTPCSS